MGTRRRDIRRTAVDILNNFGAEPYPTLAKGQVYDSKATELINHSVDNQLPTVIVYTDSQSSVPLNGGGYPFKHELELVIEIAAAGDTSGTATDRDLEGEVDLIEDQVVTLLFNPEVSEPARRFNKLFSKITDIRSLRVGNASNNHRLAMRGLVATLEYGENCLTLEQISADGKFGVFNVTTTGDGIPVRAVFG